MRRLWDWIQVTWYWITLTWIDLRILRADIGLTVLRWEINERTGTQNMVDEHREGLRELREMS